MNNDNLVECRNCKSDIKNNIRRCEYCGILNPTVQISEIVITIFIIIFIMFIYSSFI